MFVIIQINMFKISQSEINPSGAFFHERLVMIISFQPLPYTQSKLCICQLLAKMNN